MASRLTLRHVFRQYSTFSTPPISKEKTREALRLIKSETNPERILEICRSGKSPPPRCFILRRHQTLRGQTRPELNNERFISHAIVLYGHANMLPHAFRTFNHMREE